MGDRIRVEVDRALCRGYANCLDAAPDVFDLGDDDIAIVTGPDFPEARRAELERAAQRCPVKAITLSDVGAPAGG
jgi:ferredoxin